VTVTGKEFRRNGSRIKDGLRIRVAFKIQRVDGVLQVVPAGDVSVKLVDPSRKSLPTVTFKSFVEEQLTGLLERASRNSTELPDNLIPTEALDQRVLDIVDGLKLVQLKMTDGWAYLGWNYMGVGTIGSYLVDTPAIWPEQALIQLPSETLQQEAPATVLENESLE
ncbi:MAG: hypothetical protein AAGA30_17560, partial [Planctomycetota bacterium]